MYLTLTPWVTIILGIMLLITGLLFRIMHWPDLFQGLYTGLAVLIGSVWLYIKRKQIKKNKT
jgi:membrane protease YdiL (CAAX protease family)